MLGSLFDLLAAETYPGASSAAAPSPAVFKKTRLFIKSDCILKKMNRGGKMGLLKDSFNNLSKILGNDFSFELGEKPLTGIININNRQINCRFQLRAQLHI